MTRYATLCFLMRNQPWAEVLLGFKKVGFGANKYAGFGGKVGTGETIRQAAVRELAEETGIHATAHDLRLVAELTFCFPTRPAWDQVVHVFRVIAWHGEPVESREMRPAWFPADRLPFDQMWQDAPHWLPKILAGERLQMRFVFAADHETVHKCYAETLTGDKD